MGDGWTDLSYLHILKAIAEIPFPVGKKLLAEFLQGKEDHESIKRNRLDRYIHFATLAYTTDEINELVDALIKYGMIKQISVKGNLYWKVLELTEKGKNEINNPTLNIKNSTFKIADGKTIITEEDKKTFLAFGEELNSYNDQQKKAIISNTKKILCIAGAGSGKTTVLTKRIEFLIKFRSIDPKKILAITFTRKARQEMQKRIGEHSAVSIETFNSFCEKILLRYNDIIYPQQMSVITYKDKKIMISKALSHIGVDIKRAIEIYFTSVQMRSKTEEQLANIFLNDCFFVLDHFKFKNKKILDAEFTISDPLSKKGVTLVHDVCKYIEAYMRKHNIRDFADQLLDAIRLFEKHPELIPSFDHILIDEYQDVNSTQIKLIDILNPENIFCVGDPRQSIYGWRGSDIKYILEFNQKYLGSEIIILTSNYRSEKHIVDLINKSIKNMGLPDLECNTAQKKDIHLLKFDSEEQEREFIIQKILAQEVPRHEIFILARTNRQLNELSLSLSTRDIKHIIRSEERMTSSVVAHDDEITLATVHAIKGLEAELVIVMGCTSNNFPCKGSEHPALEMVKLDEYDKEEEERRLFYVAMSRAKKSLYLTHTGAKPTYFINTSMMDLLNVKEINLRPDPKDYFKKINYGTTLKTDSPEKRLRDWRKALAINAGVPSYMIMNDKTIIDIVQKMPASLEDLEEIYGLGAVKIRKYGEEILRLIS